MFSFSCPVRIAHFVIDIFFVFSWFISTLISMMDLTLWKNEQLLCCITYSIPFSSEGRRWNNHQKKNNTGNKTRFKFQHDSIRSQITRRMYLLTGRILEERLVNSEKRVTIGLRILVGKSETLLANTYTILYNHSTVFPFKYIIFIFKQQNITKIFFYNFLI